ncbi:tRNA (adenosine(37)-N6)-threonylcarbamoyltransferase complex dimerization subunit type 1 TsaB [Acinetobacter larvae]|uniref:tRNA threonylcarbamoyladenosine biosynthesis protein TsaB n=1 Tax=Acinetobacter larvae TaxID=1789224 RepID=A0A1B2LWS2_9GAMM|nr:tRNA (adenosine(37)-N6)-threonylcarbamoyltransferase complex dimerization subunit type 1 TsaB [Acinetobacter larvae]AOA57339.1 tRNA (adenosine(37)-N6)-threonylcarbamoyltransferase complex dimerization subunit type 1 TsaB [Acinetobacter larvae]
MKLLALESANEQCSVALIDEQQIQYFEKDDRPKAQTQTILPLIDQGLAQTQWALSELTAIAFSRGPGSFSGVRINAAVTQALAWANDLPVIPVSTLQATAQAAYRKFGLDQVTVISDARMKEVYIASYACDTKGMMQLLDEEKLLDYQSAAAYQRYTPVGSGITLLADHDLSNSQYQHIYADAQDIASLAMAQAAQQHWLSAEQALPVYLRDNAWKKLSEQHKSSV